MTPTAARLARLLPPPPDARPDGALLASFLADRDEAAFAELVRRHGPLVLAACRRLLPDPADAEDAFQASFLVLVRRARRLTGSAALGPWLYRVAAWTARNVRRRNARRLARTAPLPDAVPAPPTSPAPALDLDAALLALPEKYRTPLVLCHLQGWSRRDAAERLGCPEGTLSSLLARGLTRLRARLRGYDPAAALAVGLTAVPAGLSAATVSAAAATRAAAGLVPPSVAELADAVLRAFWVQKATAAAAGLAVVFALGAGVGLSVREAPGVAAQVPTAPPPRAKAAPPVDPRELAAALEQWADRAAWAERMLRRAEDALKQAEVERQRAEALYAQRAISAAQRDAIRASEEVARIDAEAARRQVGAARARLRDARERADFAARRNGADVTGTLAVDVAFPDADRSRVVVAARDLVLTSTEVTGDVPVAAWDAARRLPHVHVRYPTPHRAVGLRDLPEVALAEVLVPLPLTRDPGGYVLVRSGDRVVRLSKYPHDACVRFQEALSAAVPAGQ